MPEVFYRQVRRQKRHAAFSVTVFVLVVCLLRHYWLLVQLSFQLGICTAEDRRTHRRSIRPQFWPMILQRALRHAVPSRSVRMRRCCLRRTGGCTRVYWRWSVMTLMHSG